MKSNFNHDLSLFIIFQKTKALKKAAETIYQRLSALESKNVFEIIGIAQSPFASFDAQTT